MTTQSLCIVLLVSSWTRALTTIGLRAARTSLSIGSVTICLGLGLNLGQCEYTIRTSTGLILR